MRWYGKPPSAQSQMPLPGLTDEGQRLMDDARLWAGRHYDEFEWYKAEARRQSAGGRKASPNLVLQLMRARFRVSVPNAYAPALARIAMEDNPRVAPDRRIEFRIARSMVDGFSEAAS